ncbi:MAG: nicotinate-nucleotide adenylyltransferase [Desulfobacteraceae bacterium]|nr:nicotinate-nucleotide adenylyltransferase [Desulfobacteraceae bacterium]
MADAGVVHGRFQIFHLDHLKYILAARERCKHLIIGITNPDPTLTRMDPADPHRSLPESNPLTYFERQAIVRATLSEAGIPVERFSIVPLPVNFPELYRYYLPMDATFFLTIYDAWGRRKLALFQSLGLKVEVLWVREPDQKGISSSDVRRRIAAGEQWEHLVPPAAAGLMKMMGIPDRIRTQSGLA